MSESVKPQYIAEARFMRGVSYYYLTMLWGNIILNENSDELVNNPIVAPSSISDAFEFVMRDLEYAAKYLPETSYATGRVNKYSAFAMLSRVYLTYAGYSDNPNSGSRNAEYLELTKKAAMSTTGQSHYQSGQEVTPDWKRLEWTITAEGEINGINFDLGLKAGTYLIDDVVVSRDPFNTVESFASRASTRSIEYIEKTDEEKEALISAAMEKWIKEMVEHYKYRVHAWNSSHNPVTGWYPYKML